MQFKNTTSVSFTHWQFCTVLLRFYFPTSNMGPAWPGIFFIFIFVASVVSTSYSWAGPGLEWGSSDAWTPTGVPGTGDIVTIGSTKFATIAARSVAVESIFINKGGSLTIEQGILSSNLIECNGTLSVSNTSMLVTT